MAALLLEDAIVTFFPFPLVLTDTSIACMIRNAIFALYATLAAPGTDPVFGTFAATAVLLCHAVIAFVVQTTHRAQLSLPVQRTFAPGACIIRRRLIATLEAASAACWTRPVIRALAGFALKIRLGTVGTLAIKLTLFADRTLPTIRAGAHSTQAGLGLESAHAIPGASASSAVVAQGSHRALGFAVGSSPSCVATAHHVRHTTRTWQHSVLPMAAAGCPEAAEGREGRIPQAKIPCYGNKNSLPKFMISIRGSFSSDIVLWRSFRNRMPCS